MSREKDALKFILGNSIILRKITDALGCEKKMTDKERKVIVKDMIKQYKHENYTDSFTVNMFGPGKKGSIFKTDIDGYRNDRFDEDWGIKKPGGPKIDPALEELIFK